jgi:hypothetical protein
LLTFYPNNYFNEKAKDITHLIRLVETEPCKSVTLLKYRIELNLS